MTLKNHGNRRSALPNAKDLQQTKGPARRFLTVLLLLAPLAMLLGAPAAEGQREFRLSFRPVESALYYQIQFLPEAPSDEEIPDAPIEKVEGTGIRKMLESNIRFFRIRAVGKRDIPGLWSAVHPVERFIVARAQVFRELPGDNGGQVMYLVDQNLALGGGDRGSGLANIQYSLNGAPFERYRSPLTFDTDGAYTLRFFGVDGAGNKENERIVSFYVDRTAPKLRFSFQSPLVLARGKLWAAPNNRVFLTTTDEGVGVRGAFCRLLRAANGPDTFVPCPQSYTFADLRPSTEGSVVLEVFAEDRLGNRTKVVQLAVVTTGKQVALARRASPVLPDPRIL